MISAIALAASISALPNPVRGDFDHDGKLDIAEIVHVRPDAFQLVVRFGGKKRSAAVIESFNTQDLHDFYLAKARPGRWMTWCGKGGGEDGDPCPEIAVRLRGDTLSFGAVEASESVAIWDGRKFRVVLLSD